MAVAKQNRDDKQWTIAASKYLAIKEQYEKLKDELDEAKSVLVGLYDEEIGETNIGAGVSVNKTEKVGAIKYAQAIKDLKLDADVFEAYRGKGTTVYTVKEVIDKD